MDIVLNRKIPTGNIIVYKNDNGDYFESLSLKTYKQSTFIKAKFLGLHNEVYHDRNFKPYPFSKKIIVLVSSQSGCTEECIFCDAKEAGNGRNASYEELLEQINSSIKIQNLKKTGRIHIQFVRMGEPTYNENILKLVNNLDNELKETISYKEIWPVISTMLPKNNKNLEEFLLKWCDIKNNKYGGSAGMQFSINSTSDSERDTMFKGRCLSLIDISKLSNKLPIPIGNKYTLNFALSDFEIDGKKLRRLFDPNKFIVKLTPVHLSQACIRNNIKRVMYPYKKVEENLIENGFDVIVFISSKDEDNARITCGNIIIKEILGRGHNRG